MKLALLCGGYPPDFDAIGQYTRELALALTALDVEVTILTSGERREREGAIEICGVFDPRFPSTLAALPAAVAQSGADWLIVQYNPFGYGPRGRAPQLVHALREIRAAGATRVGVMMHETCVPYWPLPCLAMRLWQYPQFFQLCRLTERLWVSTERWSREIAVVPGAAKPVFLPVGSNIPLCAMKKSEARERLGLDPGAWIAGVFGNPHPSRLPGWVGEGVRVMRGVEVLHVGRDGAAVRSACAGVPFRDEGALDDGEVALRLRAMDVLVSPFSDGISARRSSVLAGLRHGLPVLTTARDWSDRLMLENPLVFATPVEGGAIAFARKAQEVRDLEKIPSFDFETSPFAWPVMARRLLETL